MTWKRFIPTAAILIGAIACGCAQQAPAPSTASSAAADNESAAQPASATGPFAKLGPAHGWIVGADPVKLSGDPSQEAQTAIMRAQQNPASPADAEHSETADLNHDGFVTLDEVVAVKRAGLSDQQMTDRLHRTNYVFQVTDRQRQYLLDRGVDQTVIDTMLSTSAQKAGGGPS